MSSRRNVLTLLCIIGLHGSALAQAPAVPMPVVASFSIIGDLVREVGGERVAVSVLVGPAQDAHVYQPVPGDMRVVAAAKAVFINGLHFEEFMKRLTAGSGSKADVIAVSAGITPLKAGGKHDHGSHKGHSHGDFSPDPHAWHSVSNVKTYVANIAKALSRLDPEGAQAYAGRAAAYVARLEVLDQEIRTAIAGIPKERRIVVTTHDSFGYLAKEYGITFFALQGVSTDTEITAAGLARTIREIKARKAPAVFLENITDPRKIERLAKESGAKLGGVLYSDALSKADGPAASYIAMMQHNIKQLKDALAP